MRNFRCSFLILLITVILLSTSQAFPQKQVETVSNPANYFGKFNAELVPDTRQLSRLTLKPAGLATYKFPSPLGKDAKIFAGKIYDFRKAGGSFNVVLLESAKGLPSICADLDIDAAFRDGECFLMSASKINQNDFEFTLQLPIKTRLFKNFPVFLRYRRGFTSSELKPGEQILMQSLLGYATGQVNIKNRSVLVQYQINAADGSISTTDGLMGIDIDGDGKIKNEPFSLETSAAMDDEIVFRLGDLYLSTTRLDTVRNQIVMRKREPGEYRRIELEVGKQMPDFAFIDFDNKKRTLAEFRGKFLLVDFWGLWCVDCRREIPFQFEAYNRFRARGFEILGLDTYEKAELVKPVLQKNKINWTQANFDSIKELVEKSYRIQEYPSAVLLAPDGKVLILDQSRLAGDNLQKTLDQILPQ